MGIGEASNIGEVRGVAQWATPNNYNTFEGTRSF
jgi:hypothetical protein